MGYFKVYNTQDSIIYYEGYSSSRKNALAKAIKKFSSLHNRLVGWEDCFEIFEGVNKGSR